MKLVFSALKLMFFLIFVTLSAFLVRLSSAHQSGKGGHFRKFFLPENSGGKQVYFLGTSRTRHAVNDSLLNVSYPNAKFINGGMSGGTLISSAIIAEKIMGKIPSVIIFIELSLANGRIGQQISMMADPITMFSTIGSMAEIATLDELSKVYIPLAGNYFYDYFFLMPHLKLLFGKASLNDFFGRQEKEDTVSGSFNTFLKSGDLRFDALNADSLPPKYNLVIGRLLKKAAATKSEIIFFLPVNMKTNQEKKRLISIFNQLPEKHKMGYSDQFLSKISKTKYLMDSTHFNKQGAAIYTQNLIHFLEKRWVWLE